MSPLKFHEVFIYDRNNSLVFRISASMCQLSIFCPMPFTYCKHIIYNIFDKDNNQHGKIIHLFQELKIECCTKADKYLIETPEFATVEEKVLLIMSTLFIDY